MDPVPTQPQRRGDVPAPSALGPLTGRRAAIADAVIANALPVIGILFLHWSLLAIVFYYLLESVVIGVFALAKIVRCEVVSDAWRPVAPGVPDGGAMPSRSRLVLRTGGIVFTEVIVLLALSDGALRSQGAWVVIALVILVGQGAVDFVRRFVRQQRFVTTTCAEVEVDFLYTFALFLAMVSVMAGLGALGLGDHGAAMLAVLLLVLVRGTVEVWRALGRDFRHLRWVRDYAEHLAAVDAGVEGDAGE